MMKVGSQPTKNEFIKACHQADPTPAAVMSASRSYEANVTAMSATKNMVLKALEIGR